MASDDGRNTVDVFMVAADNKTIDSRFVDQGDHRIDDAEDYDQPEEMLRDLREVFVIKLYTTISFTLTLRNSLTSSFGHNIT